MDGHWFAQVAPGLEAVLVDELAEHGINAEATPGGAEFRGNPSIGWRVCLHSRIAARIRLRVGAFDARSVAVVERCVRGLDLSGLVHPRQDLAVSVVCSQSRLRRPAVERAVRRGIASSLRGPRLPGGRPPRTAAQVDVRVVGPRVQVSLDACGERLHRRGWRKATAKAPLRENRAAAVLRLAGFEPGMSLVDPMCGSGTFVIEAAQWDRALAPGARRRFAFEDWPSHDRRAWQRLRDKGRSGRAGRSTLLGSDRADGAIRAARSNAERARVLGGITLQTVAFADLEPPAPEGLLVANPPWGERIAQRTAREVWAQLGSVVRARWRGWRVALVGPDPDLLRATGLSLRRIAGFRGGRVRVQVWVGDIR